VQEILTQEALDRLLDDAAVPPESFEERVEALIERLDAEERDLEIRDSRSWRRSDPARDTHTSFVEQFRADVETILTLNREEEARLARRIQFARMRLERERKRADAAPAPARRGKAKRTAAQRLQRRAMELHALRSEMVERNLYLVLINVERYSHGATSRLDLIQEGCVSLFRAVDGFDWKRGLLFRTYAVHWLNQAFRSYLYNFNHTVRVPVYLQKALKHVQDAASRLGKDHASSDEIAAATDLKEDLVLAARAAARNSYSIDAERSLEGGEGARLRDLLVDESNGGPYDPSLEDVKLEDGLRRALGALTDREATVLRLRFGIDAEREHTLAEVSERLGVSVERVRQIQVRGLSKLNNPAVWRELEPFLN
jgi:RNA polymerase primary sigma factor